MFWALVVIGSLAGLVVLVALLGALLPRHHTAARRARFNRPVAEVWKAITDIEAFPSWRKDLASVERLPDREGRPVWREIGKFGAMTLETVDLRPPTRRSAAAGRTSSRSRTGAPSSRSRKTARSTTRSSGSCRSSSSATRRRSTAT